jgi:hypothetical protein
VRNVSLLVVASIKLFFSDVALAQNTRLNENNTIGWYGYFGTIKLNQKVGIHTEYQFRRDNVITDWMQSLLRVGLNYQLNAKTQARVGYAWVETFPYGETPLNGFGKDFTEHRTYQMLTLNDKVETVDVSHRFMLEQRWIGRYSSPTLTKEDDYLFLNRMRYMFRMQVPLRGKTIGDKTPYLAIYDEVFLGFGKNVNENVFDQNRLGILLGYRFSGKVRVEGGFLNQIVQLGREINGRNVFQHNNGLIISTILNIDASKQKK